MVIPLSKDYSMIFKLVMDLPWMFVIALVIWLIVLGIFLYKVYDRKDISVRSKIWLTLLFIYVPVLGMLIYSILNFSKTKIFLTAVVIASILTVVDIWYFIVYKPTHQRRDVTTERSIVLTAQAVVKEYLDNETRADSLYNNKVIEISGVVEKVETDSVSATVILKTGIPNTSVSCRLKQKREVINGSVVTIKGILTGFILEQVQINEAVIMNQAVSVPSSQLTAPSKDTLAAKPAKDSAKKITSNPVEATVIKIYTTNKAQVKFLSSTTEEDIQAVNNQGISQLNTGTGQVTFAVLIKGFHFENELMQNHFNDKDYMNSDQFPKSEFKGTITNINSINFSKDGSYPVTTAGKLTIRGVTQKVTASGTFTISNGIVSLKSAFKIKRADYGITTNEVADILDITVACQYN